MNTISIFSTSRMSRQRRGKLVIDLALRVFALAPKHGARFRFIVFSLLLLAVAAGTQLVSPGPVIVRAGTPSRFTITKRMVFISEIKGNYEVYIMREDGRDWINLTHSPGDDMNPRLSPDASSIVFETRRDGKVGAMKGIRQMDYTMDTIHRNTLLASSKEHALRGNIADRVPF